MGKEHDAELVVRALQMALARRCPHAGLIHHSDRGSEYTSQAYQDLLKKQVIQRSMSIKGDCYDNAGIESFWGTLKEECLGQHIYQTRQEAREAIFEYIETFYNRKRKHSFLGYRNPLEYERQQKGKRP